MTLPPKKKRDPMGVRVIEREYPGHRAWVRTHDCSIACRHDCSGPIECAHVRTGTDGGTGIKPHDKWCLSLCQKAHREQHDIGEPAFEKKYGINMKAIAIEFAKTSPHRKKWEET